MKARGLEGRGPTRSGAVVSPSSKRRPHNRRDQQETTEKGVAHMEWSRTDINTLKTIDAMRRRGWRFDGFYPRACLQAGWVVQDATGYRLTPEGESMLATAETVMSTGGTQRQGPR